ELEAAEEAAHLADAWHEETTMLFHDAEGQRRVAAKAHEAAMERFTSLGIPAPTDAAVHAAAAEVSRLERELLAQNRRRDELLITHGRQETACQEAQKRSRDADD